MKRLPMSVTAQRGILSKKVHSSIAVIISLMMLSSLFGFGTMFLVFGGDMVGFILFTIIIGLVLYFGFKKGECPVCHGSGRLYR